MSSRPSRGAARLAAILDALPDGLLLVNCNGTVVNANTIALGMFEAPGTALVGRGLLDLLPEFDSKLIPGSMRRPEEADERGRTKPKRMTARRTDGTEYPAEVTSASLEDGQAAYTDFQGGYGGGYTGDELLMLVVRDLSGTVDTEAELARSQRQTEMILRAAAEGVVGTDTDGRVVLVNPAAAQILGFRASDLGGQELHPLILHSRGEGEPFPYEESPLADTLRSGRKHRVRGQVLWSKSGAQVPVDLTTAPVRDGDQLVGAVMTFTDRRPYEELASRHREELAELTANHTAELAELTERHSAELADRSERYAVELEEQGERLAAMTARHGQLTAVLGESLRGPLEELRGELATLAADPAGQLWPEANQILHHLAAGYARMTTLVDNVLGYQRLDAGSEKLVKTNVLLDSVVTAGIDAAVELIGPGRAQFAVHAPPIEAEVDADRLVTALAHLVADVAGIDSTGKARPVPGGGYVDSTVVVAAAQRGEVVRIEVRGPYAGGDPVHEPIVRGIVRAHGGVLQTHEVPGMSGSAYVLEVPLGTGSGTVSAAAPEPGPAPLSAPVPVPEQGSGAGAEPGPSPVDEGAQVPVAGALPEPEGAGPQPGSGRRRARRASTDAFLESPVGDSGAGGEQAVAEPPTGRRRARREPVQDEQALRAAAGAQDTQGGSGRRRGRPSPAEAGVQPDTRPQAAGQALALPASASAPAPAEGAVVTAAEGAQGGGRPQLGRAVPPQGVPADGHRGPGTTEGPGNPRASQGGEGQLALTAAPSAPVAAPVPAQGRPGTDNSTPHPPQAPQGPQSPQGSQTPQAPQGPQAPQTPQAAAQAPQAPQGRRARRALAADRERAAQAEPAGPRTAFALPPAEADRPPVAAGGADASPPARHDAVRTAPDDDHTPPQPHPVPAAPSGRRRARPAEAPAPVTGEGATEPSAGPTAHATGTAPAQAPEPAALPQDAAPLPDARRQPLPAETLAPGVSPDSTQGRAFSVRTLGQGVPFAQHIAHQQNQTLGGAGRRRKLAAPPEEEHGPQAAPSASAPGVPAQSHTAPEAEAEGRAYAIGAPDEGAEGPEPLDGPGGAVEVANRPSPLPVDDELPPEPLDNPRRLLVWPAPDVSTQQALSDRGYRPVIVHSREEVDAQIAAFPAALFVDPLTGPITRKALQSLRQAAVAAEVPVLVTAGLGQASREAAYGADPAVLLKALAPRDSEQHPPRVLLIEEHEEIALALTETLERRGMQVARAATDSEAVTLAGRTRPNLVVMDLMQVRRRRAGIVDWLRANGQLNRTPLVVYTSADMSGAELPRLGSGETVLFLAERSTSDEVQSRIVDLLAKIGTN
ncbi:PAS domain-containing protein [Streptomyces sp. NPDC059913]|uniref:hybrid sensor histidine kinase/response regulator n=1 Tax=unclassified Streptomyces TaxID=2593676 RepID=UPI0036594C55